MREYEVVDTNADNIGGLASAAASLAGPRDIAASVIGSRSATRKA